MLPSERQKQLLSYLTVKKSAGIQQLCSKMHASAATIRRDLNQMERRGLIQRTHGGAVILEGSSGEISIFSRESKNTAEKSLIGELACCFIKDSYTIFMDPSSTVCSVVPFLTRSKSVSVITNGLRCASVLSERTSCDIYILAGQLATRSNAIVGSDTITSIENYCADAALISCSGLSLESGVTEPAVEQSRVKLAMLSHAKTKILLCDHTKFGQTYLSRTCGAAEFDYLITDCKPPQEYLDYFADQSCELVYPD